MTRRIRRGQRFPAGSVVGYGKEGERICLEVDDRSYQLHDVIWLHVHGRWPSGKIEHLDLDKSNNRLSNLHEVADEHVKSLKGTELSAERLRALMHYDADTGLFTWRVTRGCSRKRSSGCLGKAYGYILIRVDHRLYRAHRLAWLYTYGRWPVGELDHINGVRHDNRIANLREATRTQNNGNSKMFSTNTSGYRGVTKELTGTRRWTGRWRAQISRGNKNVPLGTFATKAEAHAAYMKAAQEHFGEFAPSLSQGRAASEAS